VLYRALGGELGGVVGDIHRGAGVDVRTGRTVTAVAPGPNGVTITTDEGRLDCDVLVVGVGSVPNQEVAQAGIAVEDGILVDEFCATSAPGVYAVGDVARQYLPAHGRRIRVEHHDSAIRQARTAARNMLGADEPFTEVHWFWSDQYEHSIQSAGVADPDGELVVRGSLADRDFSAFRLDGDRVGSVVSLDRPRDVLDTRRLIARERHRRPAPGRDEILRFTTERETLTVEEFGARWMRSMATRTHWTHADNVASQRVAAHVGFRHLPSLDGTREVAGQRWPVRWYSRNA